MTRRRSIAVVDLAFGDCGKGTMVDYLARQEGADLVVRFNGGPQAAHNVVLPDGRHHTFAQFGSATFLPGVRTMLSRFMLIEPYAMLNEAAHLASIGVADAMSRTVIDARCRVITPPQQIANRIRERARGAGAHGTCGMGVGECAHDAIARPDLTLLAGDLADRAAVRKKLAAMLEYKRHELRNLLEHATPPERQVLEDASWIGVATDVCAEVAKCVTIASQERASVILRTAGCAIFEGAQGVLLDESYGFHPHTTWSNTTFEQADHLLDEAQGEHQRTRIGVIRSYLTRHGAGPLPTEDASLERLLTEAHNRADGWPGRFRCGVLDLPLLRYALEVTGRVDALAVTHVDRLPLLPGSICVAHRCGEERLDRLPFQRRPDLARQHELTTRLIASRPILADFPTRDAEAFTAALSEALEVPVRYISTGPTLADKRRR